MDGKHFARTEIGLPALTENNKCVYAWWIPHSTVLWEDISLVTNGSLALVVT